MQPNFFKLSLGDDPYPVYARLRQAGPAVQLTPGVWVVSRYDDVLFVLRNHQLFSSKALGGGAGFGGNTIIGSDPPEHTRLRNIVNKAFTPRMVAALEPRIREITSGLLDEIAAKGEFDLIADLAIPVPVIIIAEILGVDPERRADFKRWSDSFVFSNVATGETEGLELQSARLEFREYFQAVIEARRREPREDLISALVRAEESETLTPGEVMAFAILLLIAGNETTTNLIGNAIVALLANRDQLELLRGRPELAPNAVEEALRYESPVQLLMRTATQDVDLGGVTIPKGAFVLPVFASANRDERQFEEPDRFDIQRTNARDHVAFGYGPHFCLGAPLARLEGQVVLEEMLRRLDLIEPAYEKVEWLSSLLLRGPKRLPLLAKGGATTSLEA